MAPSAHLAPDEPVTFGVFGDMGISQAAHDTVRSISSSLSSAPLDAIFHVGDISYAIGKEAIWNQFGAMIEPVASKVPWDVVPGNHDLRSGDSGIECGLQMLARFETPRSRGAFPGLVAVNHSERCARSFNYAEADAFWWSTDIGHARVITYSTDSNLTAGSPQREWLQKELEAANAAESRRARPWVLLMGHKPMYTASTFPGEISTRPKGEAAGEGTEGALTSELEELFVKNQVDVSFYGHIHSYNRMLPVKNNGSWVEHPAESRVYRQPSAPVHMMVGMAGAPHLGAPYLKPAWSAYSEISWGWLRATFANSSALHLEFVANGDGLNYDHAEPAVHDDVWITK